MKKENPKDKISCLPLAYFSNHEINLVYLLNKNWTGVNAA